MYRIYYSSNTFGSFLANKVGLNWWDRDAYHAGLDPSNYVHDTILERNLVNEPMHDTQQTI